MTDTEWSTIWNDVVHGLWPAWAGIEQKVIYQVWYRALRFYKFETVEKVLKEHYADRQGREPYLKSIKLICPNYEKLAKKKPEPEVAFDGHAKERAIAKIMSGPDTPGRRFLVRALEDEEKELKAKSQTKKDKEPVLIKDVLTKMPF